MYRNGILYHERSGKCITQRGMLVVENYWGRVRLCGNCQMGRGNRYAWFSLALFGMCSPSSYVGKSRTIMLF